MRAVCHYPPMAEPEGRVRRATADDVPELVRLRALMFESFGGNASGSEWREQYAALLLRRIVPEPTDFLAVVVDSPVSTGPGGLLVAAGLGWIDEHLPGPMNPRGRRGYIASMSTDLEVRRKGHARRVLAALMEWFFELGVDRVDLRATAPAEPLYSEWGFDIPTGLPMTWIAPGRDDDPWVTPSGVTERA